MSPAPPPNGHFRIRLGLILILVGFLIFLIGAEPGVFGLDRSPVIGFVQIAVFLIGLALICLGGYVTMNGLWRDRQKTILADIGLRLVSTGYVIAVVSGMADIFGFGSQLSPEIPYYGPLQALGVLIGEGVIALGFILMIPFGGQARTAEKPAVGSDRSGHSDINVIIE
jgi:hypothetical protein